MANGTSRRQGIPLCDFFFITKFKVSNRVSIATNRARCSVGPDLGTNYLQSILSDSLGPVVNILTIFLMLIFKKNTTSKVSVVRY